MHAIGYLMNAHGTISQLPKPLALTAYTELRHIHIPSGRCHCVP